LIIEVNRYCSEIVPHGINIELTNLQVVDIFHICPAIMEELGDDVYHVFRAFLTCNSQFLSVDFVCNGITHRFSGSVIDKVNCTWNCTHYVISDYCYHIQESYVALKCAYDLDTIRIYILVGGFQPFDSLGISMDRKTLELLKREQILGLASVLLEPGCQIGYLRIHGRAIVRIEDKSKVCVYYIYDLSRRNYFRYIINRFTQIGMDMRTIWNKTFLNFDDTLGDPVARFLFDLFEKIENRFANFV